LRDGTHRVLLVDKPDLKQEGVVVIEAGRLENLSILSVQPERFVIITRKGTTHLTRILEAGVRHVVFEEDSPNRPHLAGIAAELRMPKPGALPAAAKEASCCGAPDAGLRDDRRRVFPRAGLSVLDSRLDLPPRCTRRGLNPRHNNTIH